MGSFSLLEIDVDAGYAEIGYWVAKDARGRGVATRAVAWLRERGAELGLTTFELLVHEDNAASQGVARRGGLRGHGRAPARAAGRAGDAARPHRLPPQGRVEREGALGDVVPAVLALGRGP